MFGATDQLSNLSSFSVFLKTLSCARQALLYLSSKQFAVLRTYYGNISRLVFLDFFSLTDMFILHAKIFRMCSYKNSRENNALLSGFCKNTRRKIKISEFYISFV